MKFINKTQNSVQLEDVDVSVPFIGEFEQSIDVDLVKKSNAFQKMVEIGAFKITENSDTRIEKKLRKISDAAESKQVSYDTCPSGDLIECFIRGHFYDCSGYAKVNRNLAFTLHRNGIKTNILPVNNQNYLNEIETRILSLLRKPIGDKSILIDSVVVPQGQNEKSKYSILYTTAEAETVPNNFVEKANQYDELWTVSRFSAQSFINAGYSKKIQIIPPIINPNMYCDTQSHIQFRPNLQGFKFLSVQTYGYRKGSDALIESFCKAFTSDDDVSLTILIAERFQKQQNKIRKQIDAITARYNKKPKIYVCFKSVPEYLMAVFYSSFDAFVLCSRGEGFGLPICEASLCGLPILSVNYGGVCDFLEANNSLLCEIDSLQEIENGKTNIYYWDKQVFPLLGDSFTSEFADKMRLLVNHYETYKARNELLKNKVIENFDGTKVGNYLKNYLADIYKKRN